MNNRSPRPPTLHEPPLTEWTTSYDVASNIETSDKPYLGFLGVAAAATTAAATAAAAAAAAAEAAAACLLALAAAMCFACLARETASAAAAAAAAGAKAPAAGVELRPLGVALRQRLKLVHFSAQRKRFRWDRGWLEGVFRGGL